MSFLAKKISEIQRDLNTKQLVHKKRDKKSSSDVWNKFHEIRTYGTNELVKYFFFCVKCERVVYNPSIDGNINYLRRHSCTSNNNTKTAKQPKLVIPESEKEKLRFSGAKFVARDLRPYSAIEGAGLLDLCGACMEFGQRNRRATKEDLFSAMPSRTTVKNKIGEIAAESKNEISKMLQLALVEGGIGATTDCWTDDYRHTTYISVVAHLAIPTDDDIDYHRFVLATNEVPEAVKSGTSFIQNLKFRV